MPPRQRKTAQCEARSPDGIRCRLPGGHVLAHEGREGRVWARWATAEEMTKMRRLFAGKPA